MSSGVYKIVNPVGKVYIGSSFHIEERINNYRKGWAGKKQPKLFNSFMKYGIDNHNFNIVEFCEKSEIKNRERYWQEYYNVVGDLGLNCVLVEANGTPKHHTELTKQKISKTLTGRKSGPLPEITKKKITESKQKRWPSKDEILKAVYIVGSLKELETLLNFSFSKLQSILKKYEIHEYVLEHYKKAAYENKLLLILRSYEKASNVKELSDIIKIGPQTIRSIIKKENLQDLIYNKMAVNRSLHENRLLLILNSYEETSSTEELSDIIKIGPQTIRSIIKKENLQDLIYNKMAVNKRNKGQV